MGEREPTPYQAKGGEFSGIQYDNTLPAKQTVDDLTPAEMRTLIVTTGQDTDPAATARSRHFNGQTGKPPKEPLPPRYMR